MLFDFNKRLFPYFWGGAILVLPFMLRLSKVLIDSVHSKNHFLFFLLCLSIICFGFGKKVSVFLVSVLGIWLLHSYLNQFDIFNQFVFYQFLCFSGGLVLLAHLTANFEKVDTKIILNFLAITALAESAFVFAESLFGFNNSTFMNLFGYNTLATTRDSNGISIAINPPVSGSLSNSNYSGALIAVSSLSLFRKNWIYFLPIILIALYVLKAAMPVVTVFVGVFVFSFLYLKITRKFFLISGISILLSLICIAFFSNEGSFFSPTQRITTWKETLRNAVIGTEVIIQGEDQLTKTVVTQKMIVGGKYFLGHGLGYFPEASKFFVSEKGTWRQIHNEYIELFYVFGFVGLIYLALILFPILKQENKNPILFSILGAVLFNCSGHFFFHISSTALIGIVIYSLILNQNETQVSKIGV